MRPATSTTRVPTTSAPWPRVRPEKQNPPTSPFPPACPRHVQPVRPRVRHLLRHRILLHLLIPGSAGGPPGQTGGPPAEPIRAGRRFTQSISVTTNVGVMGIG